MTAPATTYVDRDVAVNSRNRGVTVTTLLKIGRAQRVAAKARIVFDLDGSYQFQSSAFVDVWSETDLRWNRIHTIPGADLSDDGWVDVARAGRLGRKDADEVFERAFEADYDRLVAFAEKVLR